MGSAASTGISEAVCATSKEDLLASLSPDAREKLKAVLSDAPTGPAPYCHMRIFHVNDVYLLDNFAALRTCIDALSEGMPKSNTLTTLAGDFVAPSLLSSIDLGRAMVATMNDVGVDAVCFGNHESDIPHCSLLQRIGESKFTWLNSNMRSFSEEEDLPQPCPDNMVRQLEGGRNVALIGLCAGGGKSASLYREGAFNGHAARITPILEAAEGAVARAKAAADCVDVVLPMTHQDVSDDRLLAEMNLSPVILGGHDHGVFMEQIGDVHICKAGEDAFNVAVIDLEWEEGAPRGPPTSVKSRLIPLAQGRKHKGPPPELPYKPHEATAWLVERLYAPAEELKRATLAIFDNEPEILSSVGVRKGEKTMASRIATALASACKADGALINAGAVRGNRDYLDGVVNFAHLAAECPFPSENITVVIDGATISAAVVDSRGPWYGGEGHRGQAGTSALALHCDEGMKTDPATGAVLEVCGAPIEPDRLYKIVIDSYLMRAIGPLKAYADKFPERVPPDDAGQPALPILVRYFCDLVWHAMIDTDGDGHFGVDELTSFFKEADTTGDGMLSTDEMLSVIQKRVPNLPTSAVLAKQCISFADSDKNGKVSYEELTGFILAEAPAHMQ